MRVFDGFEGLPAFRHPAATIGSYDGVHLGHGALIRRLVEEARNASGESLVLTFEPHPRITLGRAEGLQLLTTLDQKLELLAGMGVDNTVVIPFDRAFSSLTALRFAREYLVERLGVETLVVGYNHRFGHDRLDTSSLGELPLRIVHVDERFVAGHRVSSTIIRRLLDEGRTAEAEELLGHPLEITTKHWTYDNARL